MSPYLCCVRYRRNAETNEETAKSASFVFDPRSLEQIPTLVKVDEGSLAKDFNEFKVSRPTTIDASADQFPEKERRSTDSAIEIHDAEWKSHK